jgi:hypothetical protein
MAKSEAHAALRVDRARPLAHRVARRIAGAQLAVPVLFSASAAVATAREPDWDQGGNNKDAATPRAQMQRTQGATRAFAFIEACYKTHSLSSNYTKAFEACIAQDYLGTQILALIYSRMPPETLKKLGAPSPEVLAQTMGKRIAAAFATYEVPIARVKAFKKLVDEHGFPVFFKALFPGVDMPVPKLPPLREK